MICPKCGSERAKRNGGGRVACPDCRQSSYVPPDSGALQPVPDGYVAKGTSTLYREDGSIAAQWVKTTRDLERQHELLIAAVDAMKESVPKEKPVRAPSRTRDDLLTAYVLTDYHLGMLSWHEETGADWDTEIAEDLLTRWFGAAIAQSPDSGTAIFAQLGDFLHWDGLESVTPTSKHVLDADTRYPKLVRVAIRVIRRVVRMLLQKHDRVHVLMAEGNHDIASSVAMREFFSAMFEGEPRLTVETSPDPYYCYEHGLTSLFFHHGHLKKLKDVDSVFVRKFRDVFGRTRYAYAHMGHLHHIDVKETNLMVVEQHRTLAAPDAYASRGGWMSDREAKWICYSRQLGEVCRGSIRPEMLEVK